MLAGWTEPEALSLLRSVIETNNEFVYNVLQPLVFVDEERDQKIFYLISPFMKYDCDNMFHLRMDLLERYPAWFNRSLTLSMAEDHPDHFIDCLLFVLRHWNICNSINTFGQFSDKLVVQKSDRILSEILPAIIQMTAFNGSKNNCETLDRWSNSWGHYYNGRVFVRLLEKTIAYKAEENKNFPKQFLEDHWEVRSSIEKELVMKVLRLLPVKDASLAYTWFLQNFPENLFEYTSENNSVLILSDSNIHQDRVGKGQDAETEEQQRDPHNGQADLANGGILFDDCLLLGGQSRLIGGFEQISQTGFDVAYFGIVRVNDQLCRNRKHPRRFGQQLSRKQKPAAIYRSSLIA